MSVGIGEINNIESVSGDGSVIALLKRLRSLANPVACAAADVHEPASNTAAVVTYAAVAAKKHTITGVAWSYDGAPTGGSLKIEDVSGTTIFSMSITAAGAGMILFPRPKQSAAVNTALIITLAAGGSGVTGKLTVLNHWTE